MAEARDTQHQPRRARSGRLAKLSLAVASMVVVALAFEGCLQGAVALGFARSYCSMYAGTIPDERLMWRLAPNAYVDIDDKGYRNEVVPDRVDIVAIGDSQTYGYNAFSDESWPMQLGRMTNKSVYSMAIGGWGPVQYTAVLDEALELQPETVLFGFYIGNDLHNACSAGGAPYWRDQFSSAQLDMVPCVAMADAFPPQLEGGLRELAKQSEVMMRIKQIPIVSAFIMVGRDLQLAEREPANYFVVRQPTLETVVQLGPRLSALDPQLPEVRSGTAIAKHLYDQVSQKIPGDRWGVLFISTKAAIVYDYLLATGEQLPENFHSLVRAERAAIVELKAFFDERGVRSVDTTPALASLVAAGERLFPPYLDGHPTKIGYRGMAEAALPLVQ